MKIKLWISAFLCAALATISVQAQDCNSCNQAPDPVVTPVANPFSWEIAKKLYKEALMPTQEELQGQWTLVGLAVGQPPMAQPFFGESDGYQENGIKNADGSPQNLLQFQVVSSGGTDFAGNPLPGITSVNLENLGTNTYQQGPYSIDFNAENQAACFAQFLYYFSKPQDKPSLSKSHVNYSCRILKENSQKMVCVTTFVFDSSNLPSNPVELATDLNIDGAIISYMAYVKK